MLRYLRKLSSVFLALVLSAGAFCIPFLSLTALADDSQEGTPLTDEAGVLTCTAERPDISSECACLIDARTGSLLYVKNAETACDPASITKVMTALLVLENCEDLSDTVTFSNAAVNGIGADSSRSGAYVGEEFTVEQALYGLLVKSGNDCAVALAEYIAGSESAFCSMMNARAKELGCTGTHFSNSHGLSAANHYTTAHDMARIMQAACQYEEFLRISSTYSYQVPTTNIHPDGLDPWYSGYKLINSYSDYYDPYVIAGKTGYTEDAFNTLVTCAEKGDSRLICVIMQSSATQYEDTETLCSFGFKNFSSYNMSEIDSYSMVETGFLSLIDGTDDQTGHVSIVPETDCWIILPDTVSVSEIQSSISYEDSKLSGQAATVIYTYLGEEVGRAVLLLKADRTETVFQGSKAEIFTDPSSISSDFAPAALPNSGVTGFRLIYLLIPVFLLLLFLALFLFFRRQHLPPYSRRRRTRRKR